MSTKPVVAIAMSGGVDSSVAAALLVESGFTVIGIMLRLWNEEGFEDSNRCCTPDSMASARRVATILSIPFYVLDARQQFYDSVISPFIDGYANNTTPNPCLFCNRSIRWQFLFNHAISAGADLLATGHYARIFQKPDGEYQLLRGKDLSKDQSYILHILSQDKLKQTIFPLGEYTKLEVRRLAQKFDLPVAEKHDSQDLCFVGEEGNYRWFLRKHAPQSLIPGQITDLQGNVLGLHQGLALFTIGQRKGLLLNSQVPLYVLDKNFQRKTLIVGTREQSGREYLIAENANWIAGYPPDTIFRATIKIRYRAHELPAIVNVINKDRFSVKIGCLAHDITPGQAAVLYNEDICIGGGIITNENSDYLER